MAGPGNLFLIGMMGAGKTTVGRLLARRLRLRFFDCDHEIERRCGVKVPTIFDIEGESGFRLRESQTLAELTALDDIVLATGGGAVLAEENRRCLAARGTVAYLCARPEELYERVRQYRNRPLLATDDPLARLRDLHAQRDALYRAIADVVIDSGRLSIQAVTRTLAEELAQRWKASA